MSEELSIEILKQATLETTTGACEKCPRKDKNKTCIGCLDEAKEKVLDRLQQKENIIKEVREWAKKYSCQFTNDDGELVVSEVSFNLQARPCDLFKILEKGE